MARKLTKAEVDYRPASPLAPGQRCGLCGMFRPGGGCTLVRGYILRLAVCDRWVARAGRR